MRQRRPDMRVTSREGRVSRNPAVTVAEVTDEVTSREGRVSRNAQLATLRKIFDSHVPRGTCE